MNIRDEDKVSAVALVVESEAQTAAQVIGDNGDNGAAPVAEEPTALTDDAPASADDPAGPADDEAAPDSE